MERKKLLNRDVVLPYSKSDSLTKVRGELMKGVNRLCYRMRGYNERARTYFCYLRIQDRKNRGISFRFNTEGYTNLDDYIFYECLKGAGPRIKRLFKASQTMRGIGIGTVMMDYTNQQELFLVKTYNSDSSIR